MSLEKNVWQTCATRLIETGELDPVYTMLCGARDSGLVDENWLSRFCLYHLMFYDVGGAIKVAHDNRPFWEMVNERYATCRRGQERRHFRGENGLKAIASMKEGTPLGILTYVYQPGYSQVYKNISTHYSGFGPYFRLKWADYLNVVFRKRIDFTGLAYYMFEGAMDGVRAIWPERRVDEGLEEIREYISQYKDPFDGSRKCGNAEAETVACGVKVYCVNTTFKFGWDVRHLHETLDAHPIKGIASKLKRFVPKRIPE